ncbi:EamA family transporter [Bacillus lacus]|uniref:EamA family transporter n=1 Tax=Metabacillus lacus TaxID=1983721 RepID=A0A7X2M0G1_9BACI|nr:EamA family transporter [Metabacillus lacus]MRX74093.1 EamA family transporter [Metabacillus lacus]
MGRPEGKLYPYIALCIGVLAVSTSAIFVVLSSSPAPVTAFYRLFFSVLLLLPYFLKHSLPELRTFSRRDWLYSAVAGVFLAFHFVLWFQSLQYTSVASSVVLVTLQPLFAFAGTYLFFKEVVSWKEAACAGFAIIGSVIISWGDFTVSGLALWGDFLALAACAMITAYLLFGQEVRKRHSLTAYTFIVYSFCAMTILLYCLFTNIPLVPVSAGDWKWFLLLALIPTLLGHSLFNWALEWISTNTVSVFILFEPVGAIILAYYLFGETLSIAQTAGSLLIISGILFFAAGKRNQKVPLRDESAKKIIQG